MIQNVEVLHPELEIDAFRDGCCLGECQIKAEAMPDVAVSRGIKLLPKVGRYLPEWHRKCGFTRRHGAVTRAYPPPIPLEGALRRDDLLRLKNPEEPRKRL
jgi:hypothetical protein